ncbi:MAG: hypothetical protein OSJ73_07110 [Lachnospiraceae bacterium]|nr:hypothetical protein [Lachnospiraceae bacterium]
MAGTEKIAELEKTISDTREELAAVRQEKKAAADSPERLVLAEKQERRIAGTLAALERAKAAATYKPPEPTDCAELLMGLSGYMDEKAEKEAKAAAAIEEARREEREIERALQQAAADCDAEKTVELAEKREELQSRLKYLAEMQQRVKALPTFPEGAFAETWEAVCRKAMPDWKRQILQVETLAAEYKAACAALMATHDTLKNAREEIGRMALAEGCYPPSFAPVFTAELAGRRLAVEKSDYIRLVGLESPITGQAL